MTAFHPMIRTVKPQLFFHEGLYDAEVETDLPVRLGFIGLFCQCDSAGRFQWKPRSLGSQIFPFENIDFSRVLDALVTGGQLAKYEVDGAEFGVILSWKTHQMINGNSKASDLPAPPLSCCAATGSTRNQRVDDASVTRATRKGKEGKGKEGKGKEGKGKERKSSSNESLNAQTKATEKVGFDLWYSVYPRHAGRKIAERQYQKALADVERDDHPRKLPNPDPWFPIDLNGEDYLLDRAIAYAASPRCQVKLPNGKPDFEFVLHPSSYLYQGRYDDDPQSWEISQPSQGNGKPSTPSPYDP